MTFDIMDDEKFPTGARLAAGRTRVNLDGLPATISMCLAIDGSAAQITQLTVSMDEGQGLSALGLRSIKPNELKQSMLDALLGEDEEERAPVAGPRWGKGPTDDDLRVVAEIYSRAAVRGKPVRAVQAHFGFSNGSAQRWVKLAREAGYLGPA